MPQKTLAEWLSLLEASHPTEIELGLDRIGRVAQQLGFLSFGSPFENVADPKLKSDESIGLRKPAKKIITVAGTNGKGSCVAAIESILIAAGYKVGCYTSPHFIHYNERICIQGKPVTNEALCAAFEEIETARGDISLSYFEFGTLAAFLIMANSELDVAILEVGLGGRLDAVNVIDTDIAVVTSIALDHQDWLGNDLDKIAMEKASIGRQGKPLVCGDMEPVSGLLQTADKIGVQLLINGRDFSIGQFNVMNESSLPLSSVACALKATELVHEQFSNERAFSDQLPKTILEKGLAKVELAGRFQQMDVDGINLILDVAHNPQAAELLAQRLSVLSGRIIAVAGIMSDKDINGILVPMMSVVENWYFCEIPEQERAATTGHLRSLLYNAEALQKRVVEEPIVIECKSPVEAVQTALSKANKGDNVVVFGSFFTVGPVLDWIKKGQGV